MISNNLNKTKSEQEHQEQIKILNELLNETIELTSTDFLNMCRELTSLGAEKGNKEDISRAVKELQYVDALRQKFQHILHFHEAALTGKKITDEDGDEIELQNILGSVFKLNYFQIIAAQDEFGWVIKKVQSLMRKIKPFEDTISFSNLVRINNNFRKITMTLDFLVSEYVSSADFDLSQVTDYFSEQYSMLSERIVLNWCASSEYESIEDFRRYYSTQDRSENIELF